MPKITKEVLMAAGCSRVDAWVVEILSDGIAMTSRDIERASDVELRQPEVSTGTSKLYEKHFVTVKENESEGKGRPAKTYSMNAKQLKAFLVWFIESKEKQIRQVSDNLDTLRKIAGGTKG